MIILKIKRKTKMSENTIKAKWRPLMGIVYCLVVLFDFMIAPILWALFQAQVHGSVGAVWEPLTLAQGGLFHVCMGAVLGVTSWSRGQEKIKGMDK
jgi:hypothetical protein